MRSAIITLASDGWLLQCFNLLDESVAQEVKVAMAGVVHCTPSIVRRFPHLYERIAPPRLCMSLQASTCSAVPSTKPQG
jgi:hypothetical protein